MDGRDLDCWRGATSIPRNIPQTKHEIMSLLFLKGQHDTFMAERQRV